MVSIYFFKNPKIFIPTVCAVSGACTEDCRGQKSYDVGNCATHTPAAGAAAAKNIFFQTFPYTLHEIETAGWGMAT